MNCESRLFDASGLHFLTRRYARAGNIGTQLAALGAGRNYYIFGRSASHFNVMFYREFINHRAFFIACQNLRHSTCMLQIKRGRIILADPATGREYCAVYRGNHITAIHASLYAMIICGIELPCLRIRPLQRRGLNGIAFSIVRRHDDRAARRSAAAACNRITITHCAPSCGVSRNHRAVSCMYIPITVAR